MYMNNLICRLRKEILENHYNNDIKVHSYYKYNLDPIYLNHNIDFNSKYDEKPAFITRSEYNGNKYNLQRNFDEPIIHYKADNFIPDSYYEYNLKNTDHKKMMLNNIETENEISNDFNRRQRQSESGQPLQEIKNEDDERAQSLKKLLDQYNSDINAAKPIQEIEEYSDKIKQLDNKYHRLKINKADEDIEFNNNIHKYKKLNKEFTNNDLLIEKRIYYSQNTKNKKIMNEEYKTEIDNEIEKLNNSNDIKKNNEDIKTKKQIELEMKRIKLESEREAENENKIRRKIKLKRAIKSEIENDENPTPVINLVEASKVFIQDDYNNYLNNLLKERTEFIGEELIELHKKLVFSNLNPLGPNTKILANALKRINEQYSQNNELKTQDNTPIKPIKPDTPN